MQQTFRGGALVVVQHNNTRFLQPVKQFLEKSPGESVNPKCVFRSQKGQIFFFTGKLFACQAQVIEKCGDVRVAFINLIPNAGKLAFLYVAGDKGCFA
ncbi:MAG: hypothetical protein ACQES5_10525 [Thermodesulfobacteriota bacterium]